MAGDIYSEFSKACRKHKNRPLVIEWKGASFTQKTYAEASQDVQALASYLSTLPLSPGDRVALLSENRYEWLISYFASMALGLIVVPLDPKLSWNDWGNFIDHSEAKALFLSDAISRDLFDQFLHAKTPKYLISLGETDLPSPRIISLAKILKEKSTTTFPDRGIDPDETATLPYSSGTTGVPKGVLLSHRSLLHNAVQISRRPDSKGKVLAIILPFHHIYGFVVSLANILKGMGQLIYRKIDVHDILKSFQEIRPHAVSAVPVLYERLGITLQRQLAQEIPEWARNHLRNPAYRLFGNQAFDFHIIRKFVFRKVHRFFGGRVEYLTSGGAPLEPWIGRLFNLVGLPILEGYGLTETAALISANDAKRSLYRLGSVGKISRGIKIKIDQPDLSKTGEICVKGPVLMKGYYKNDAETREALDDKGFFHTGDLGHLDSDGFLFITGRKKSLIISATGKKVSPEELEIHFAHLPLVKEICAFGIPRSPGSQAEILHLQVVPNWEEIHTGENSNWQDLIKFEIDKIARHLPEFKRPQSVGFSSQPFPKTTIQKIKRFEIKESYLKQSFQKTSAPQPSLETVNTTETSTEKLVKGLLRDLISSDRPIDAAASLTLDLGLDSLTRMEFWSQLEEALGVRFPEEEIIPLTQVGAIIEYLKDKTFPSAFTGRLISSQEVQVSIGETRRKTQAALHGFPILRPLFLNAFRHFFKLFSHLKIQGLEHLPEKGPYILAPNHESYLDNIFVACVLPRQVQKTMAVIAAKEFFDRAFTRMIARLCHAIPVDRDQVSRQVLEICGEILKDGKILLIHPEGTRSPDGHLLPFKEGVAFLAFRHQCPIVPVSIDGAHEFWPKYSKIPRRRSSITVTLLEPITPPPLRPDLETPQQQKIIHDLTNRLWTHLALHSGEMQPPPSRTEPSTPLLVRPSPSVEKENRL